MIEKIYLSLPFMIQNMLISIAAIFLEKRRMLKQPPSELTGVSTRELHQVLLKRAFSNALESRFWRGVFYRSDVNTQANDMFLELKKLPILDKSVVVKNSSDISVETRDTVKLKTSGTTGAGLNMTTTKYAESVMWYFFERYRDRFGIKKGDWCGYFCGRTLKKSSDLISPNYRVNYVGKQIMFSCYHLSVNNVDSYIDALNKYQPPWIHGYPSFLSLLSQLALERKLELDYHPKAITLGSESLSKQQRSSIYNFFKVKPTELYCQTEGVAMISECQYGNLHVDEEFSYVEFLPLQDAPGFYEVVGTSLYNFSFPLFRYRTGDIVELSDQQCRCEGGRTVKSIDGRKEEYLELKNGIKVGRLDHIFKNMVNVREAQIYQRKDLSVLFRVVKGDGFTSLDEKSLIVEINKRLNGNIVFDIDYVDSIERTKTGKLRFVIKE